MCHRRAHSRPILSATPQLCDPKNQLFHTSVEEVITRATELNPKATGKKYNRLCSRETYHNFTGIMSPEFLRWCRRALYDTTCNSQPHTSARTEAAPAVRKAVGTARTFQSTDASEAEAQSFS
jgi:hypothetical protein